MTLDDTATLCVLCPPQRAKLARPGTQTDWDCHERLYVQVVEVANRYVHLSAQPGRSAGGGRRAPGYASRPPLNLHAAMLRDPRTAPAELGDPHSPLNLVITWARWIRAQRGQPPATYPAGWSDLHVITTEAGYLTGSMDWITRQPWVATFAEQLRAVLSQVRAATGEPNPKPVGSCTATLPEGTTCGHPLFPPRRDETSVVCGGCEAVYDPLEQIRLVRAQRGQCDVCAHLSVQHGHDTEARPCNVRWCDCASYQEYAP